MAVDTPNLRGAAVHVFLPVRIILPFPDGDIDANDRAALAYSYPGFEISEPGGVVGVGLEYGMKHRRMHYTMRQRG